MSQWVTSNSLPQPLNTNKSSEFIVFAPKTPSKKNKKSRNNVYFVNNDNGQPLEEDHDHVKDTRNNNEFKVCQTPMIPKRSKSMIEERTGQKLVRSQSLLEELNSIAAEDDKINGGGGGDSNDDGNDNGDLSSAKLEIKNLFEASFRKGSILNRSRNDVEDDHKDNNKAKPETSFSLKGLYEEYLNKNNSDSPTNSNGLENNHHSDDDHDSSPSHSFKKWLPKDINNSDESNEKTPSVSDHENSSHSPTHGMDELEQLKHQYSQSTAFDNRRFSFSPSPSPTPISYSREISLSPTFNKIKRKSSFTLVNDNDAANKSFLDFTSSKKSIFEEEGKEEVEKLDQHHNSFISFNPRPFDLSSSSSSGDTTSHPINHSKKDGFFQKPWDRFPIPKRESPPSSNEEIMKTPSKRKLLKPSHPMFTFTSPSTKRKIRPFDEEEEDSSQRPPTLNIKELNSDGDDGGGDQDRSQYLKVPILSTPKKRRINLLKVSSTKPSSYNPNYLAPTTTTTVPTVHRSDLSSPSDTNLDPREHQHFNYSHLPPPQQQNYDIVMTPSKKYNIFTVAPTPTKYTSLFD